MPVFFPIFNAPADNFNHVIRLINLAVAFENPAHIVINREGLLEAAGDRAPLVDLLHHVGFAENHSVLLYAVNFGVFLFVAAGFIAGSAFYLGGAILLNVAGGAGLAAAAEIRRAGLVGDVVLLDSFVNSGLISTGAAVVCLVAG